MGRRDRIGGLVSSIPGEKRLGIASGNWGCMVKALNTIMKSKSNVILWLY